MLTADDARLGGIFHTDRLTWRYWYDMDLGVAPDNEIGFGDPTQEAYWLSRLSRLAQNRSAENYIC